MEDRRNTGIAVSSIGVLIVVMRYVLDVSATVGLAMSLTGAGLALVGAIIVWRAGRT